MKGFTAAIRTRLFAFLRSWSIGDDEAAIALLDRPDDGFGQAWTPARLRAAREAHRADHSGLRLDPEARNIRHTGVKPADDGAAWRIEQMLIDPEGLNDWVAEADIDIPASRDAGQPVLALLRLGPFG